VEDESGGGAGEEFGGGAGEEFGGGAGEGIGVGDARVQRVLAALPLTLLVTSALLHVALDPAGVRWALFAPLAVAGGAWGHLGWRRLSRRAERGWAVAGYLAGLWVLHAALIALDPVFVLAAIAGLVAAPMLTLDWRGVPGVAAFAVLVNLLPGGLPEDGTGWAVVCAVVLVEAVVIGSAGSMSRWAQEQSERRRRAVLALRAAAAENAALHERLVRQAREAGAAAERVRLAREIHDTLAQGMVGVLTQVQAAQRSGAVPAPASTHLQRATALARTTLAEARRSLHDLRPEPLERDGLVRALRDVVERWAADTGVAAELVVDRAPTDLPTAVEVALLRAGQEALANVARHARARRVVLTLAPMDDVVALDVRDDGRGFDPSATSSAPHGGTSPGGLGLVGMRERVGALGGVVDVESAPGRGTAVSVRIPLAPAGTPGAAGTAGTPGRVEPRDPAAAPRPGGVPA
ncbi:sensor histidine kinase, partial [Kineococcus indalonis]|uniref:sensor histidine kinase n=1 Tax=Kineococcus indalonis TaxID=2696566 RepID=UPI00141258E2